jgi:hypothetical protein
MRIALLVVPCLLLLPSAALAQAPFPGAVLVNGGWVPCNHDLAIAAGQGCDQAPAPEPPPAPPASTCPKIIPNYFVLMECAARPAQPVNPWTKGTFSFEVGTLYGWTYPSKERLLVISVALDIDSLRRIVTGRRLSDGVPVGAPVVFYEDQSGGWVPLRPGETK